MVGVLFIVTIPTEQEEQTIRASEKPADFGHSSIDENPNQRNDKFEYGTFKIVSEFYSNLPKMNSSTVFVDFCIVFIASKTNIVVIRCKAKWTKGETMY